MRWIILIAIISLTFAAGFYLGGAHEHVTTHVSPVEEKKVSYPYLATRIFQERPNDILLDFIDLNSTLREYVNSSENFIGVYFEYLPSGTKIGINDHDVVFAASLLKIPMAMEIVKGIENKEISWNEKLIIRNELIDKGFGNLWTKGVGHELTIEEAIRLAVVESDNTAYRLLRDKAQNKDLEFITKTLDLPLNPTEHGAGITAENYSSILKSLYFSSFLSFENSNKILDIMTVPTERDMLTRRIPSTVKVANKIGVFNPLDGSDDFVYSDCGIFYIPKRQYILCVVTKNASSETASQQIADLSKIIYEYVSSHK